MKIHHPERGSHVLSEINIIPLVDIMLVLLIIFMITAPLLQQGIDIELPEVNSGAVKSTTEDVVLSINNRGNLFLGDDKKTPYTLETLGNRIQSVFENKQKKELYLRADEGVQYGYVVKVMALCQNAGVERVGMITTPEDEQK